MYPYLKDKWKGMFVRKNGKGFYEVYCHDQLVKDDCRTAGEAEREFLKYKYGENNLGRF